MAQGSLGIMYGTGRGVPRNYVQAYKWLSLQASKLPSGGARDRVVDYRERLATHMTPAQIAEAQRLAREWKPKTQ